MSLSIDKLHKLLKSKDCSIISYYTTVEYNCLFIKLISNYIEFLMYIPSKYDVIIDPYTPNTFVIKNEEEIEEPISNSPIETKESSLQPIQLNNINLPSIKTEQKSENKNAKYLEKLITCVENIPYKLAIFNKYKLNVISRNNEVMIYKIPEKTYGFYVVIDLEVLSLKTDILVDIVNVKKSLDDMFYKNYKKYEEVVTELSHMKNFSFNTLIAKLKTIDSYVARLDIIYQKILSKEKSELAQLGLHASTHKNGTIDKDVSKVHTQNQIHKELDRLSDLKNKVCFYLKECIHNKNMINTNINRILFANDEYIYTLSDNLKKIKILMEAQTN